MDLISQVHKHNDKLAAKLRTFSARYPKIAFLVKIVAIYVLAKMLYKAIEEWLPDEIKDAVELLSFGLLYCVATLYWGCINFFRRLEYIPMPNWLVLITGVYMCWLSYITESASTGDRLKYNIIPFCLGISLLFGFLCASNIITVNL